MNNNLGYTFLEMLVVLSLLSAMVLVTNVTFHQAAYKKETEHFFEQLETDIRYAQMRAMIGGFRTDILFEPDQNSYRIRQRTTVIKRAELPDHLQMVRGTFYNEPMSFLANGGVARIGRLVFADEEHEYTLTVLLGKGRFYIEKT
ncbi:competence type IV pilus minor pilin ComGD [Texcoconibacillus texcoconensis]|uniref:Competence protein ComGD n=1 Tax=Texcoconibacillus texcoconensis TaxID=1095777 RepID=A0A840QNY5_9BACI|nr:competence type IV pilus minor pilin ComGD [Texcoconibacillus texcoconensis]MBB5173106.1 competence protein ComGD [Texcoconibacillus texcoconensis]